MVLLLADPAGFRCSEVAQPGTDQEAVPGAESCLACAARCSGLGPGAHGTRKTSPSVTTTPTGTVVVLVGETLTPLLVGVHEQ